MRIKVGNTWFEPTVDAPAMVVLTPKEKQDIGSMSPDATMYAVFADDCAMSSNERLAWMTQPDPTTTPEGRYALVVGHPIPIHQADTIGVDEPPKRRNPDLATAILKQLTVLSVGSCSCGVKSPDVHWHDAGCKYRLSEEIRENVEALEEKRADQWRLRRDAEASRDVARSACDTMRQERDAALSHPEPVAQEAVAAFGDGKWVIDTGTLAGRPAVFVAPAKMPGEVGAAARREGAPLDRMIAGEWCMTFPTDEQAKLVADALCSAPPPDGVPVLGWMWEESGVTRVCRRCQGNLATDLEGYLHGRDVGKGDETTSECPDCDGYGRPESAVEEAVGWLVLRKGNLHLPLLTTRANAEEYLRFNPEEVLQPIFAHPSPPPEVAQEAVLDQLRKGKLSYQSESGPVFAGPTALESLAADHIAALPHTARDQAISDCALEVWRALSGTPSYTDARILAERAILAMRALPSPSSSTQEVVAGFAETLNFYISGSEDGISRVPRQKLVEIQTELRRLAHSSSSPEQGDDLVQRLTEVYEHDWRISFLAHTSDTAREAATELSALRARVAELEARATPQAERCEHCGSKGFWCDWDFSAGESPCHRAYLKTGATPPDSDAVRAQVWADEGELAIEWPGRAIISIEGGGIVSFATCDGEKWSPGKVNPFDRPADAAEQINAALALPNSPKGGHDHA